MRGKSLTYLCRYLQEIKTRKKKRMIKDWKSISDLTKESKAYKPFKYPWAVDYWALQQQIHWISEELQFGDDVKDWAGLEEVERGFLTNIFRFFTQADVDVHDGYSDLYIPLFKNGEVRRMLTSFANMETIHVSAYAKIIETLAMPEIEFSRFLQYEEMRKKHDFLSSFSMNNEREVLRTMAAFGAFTEGLQLFASFAMLLNFPRHGKMQGMGQVVTFSARDETLHCMGVISLFHQFSKDLGIKLSTIKDDIMDIAKRVVEIEDAFIDLAFKSGDLEDLKKADLKSYIRYICNLRLDQLGFAKLFDIRKHPMPWITAQMHNVEHSNFFEIRATEYSKGASKGTWEDAFTYYLEKHSSVA